MSRIGSGTRRPPRTWIDMLFLPAQRPAVRAALVGTVLLAFVTLGVQALETLADMRRIEQRFSRGKAPAADVRVRYEVDLSNVRVTREQDLALHAAGILPESGSRLLVTDHLVQLLKSLIDRPTAFAGNMDLFAKNPDWNSVIPALSSSLHLRFTVTQSN